MPITEYIYSFIANKPQQQLIFSIILLYVEALMLYFIFDKYDILTERSYLPSLVYISLMSCAPLLTQFHPTLLANFFLIWAIDPLINLYRNEHAAAAIFNISLLVSLATFAYLPALVLFPVIWIGLFVFRPFNLREWLVAFTGIVVPFWFAFVYYYWNNQLSENWFNKIVYPLTQAPRPKPIKKETIYLVIALLLLMALSLSKVLEHLGSTSVKTGKVMSFLFWFMVFGFFSSFIAPTWTIRDFTFMAIPLAVFIGNYLNLARAKWLAELLFGFLIFSIILLRLTH